MTILIINNYYAEKDFWKAQGIADRLSGLGRDDYKVVHFTKISEKTTTPRVEAIILSGSTGNLSKKNLLEFKAEEDVIRNSNIPVLGVCFGHQLIARTFGSEIGSDEWVKGFKKVKIIQEDDIFASWKACEEISLCHYHQEFVKRIPADFTNLAESETCKIEAMKHKARPIYGVQAHIERAKGKNPDGLKILQNFLVNVVEKPKPKQMTLQCAEEGLKQKVEESEQKYGISDCIYDKCLQEMENLTLAKLSKDHEIRIFRPFLLTWGTMGRHLGYEGVSAIFNEVRSLSQKIEPLRYENLSITDLSTCIHV